MLKGTAESKGPKASKRCRLQAHPQDLFQTPRQLDSLPANLQLIKTDVGIIRIINVACKCILQNLLYPRYPHILENKSEWSSMQAWVDSMLPADAGAIWCDHFFARPCGTSSNISGCHSLVQIPNLECRFDRANWESAAVPWAPGSVADRCFWMSFCRKSILIDSLGSSKSCQNIQGPRTKWTEYSGV